MSNADTSGLKHYRIVCRIKTRVYVDIQGVLSRLDTCFDDKGEEYGVRNTRAEAASKFTLDGEKVEQDEYFNQYEVYLTSDTERDRLGLKFGLVGVIEDYGQEYGLLELTIESIQ